MVTRAPSGPEAEERIRIAKDVLDEHPTMSIAMILDGEPWAAKAFFVEDEPEGGRFDLCCALVLAHRKRELFEKDPRMAFVVAGESADRWIQGIGTATICDDAADARAVIERLTQKAPEADRFLREAGCTPVRVHVERLKVTDLSLDPPVAEFTFA